MGARKHIEMTRMRVRDLLADVKSGSSRRRFASLQGGEMLESVGVRNATHRFFDRLSAGDVDAFYQLVELGSATLVVGTAPSEIVREEERLRQGFEAEGLAIRPGVEHSAWEEGDLGWYVGEPTVVLPDGRMLSWRMTLVWHREGEAWKLIHMHASVGVPDEEVHELQARWGTAPITG